MDLSVLGFILPFLYAGLMMLESALPVLTFFLTALQFANFFLAAAIVLQKWNITGADIGTGTTFDTVEEAMILALLMITRAREGAELLR